MGEQENLIKENPEKAAITARSLPMQFTSILAQWSIIKLGGPTDSQPESLLFSVS
jgi:hypothetical protein